MHYPFPLQPLPTTTKKVVMFSPWPDDSFHHQASQYITGAQNRDGSYKTHSRWSAKNERYEEVSKFQGKKHKAPGTKTYFHRELSTGENLADLTENDRLYIMGHGIEDAKQPFPLIRGDVMEFPKTASGYFPYPAPLSNGFYPALTPEQLIEKLKEARLPEHVRDIRLWVCKSGDILFSTFAWEFTGAIKRRNKTATVTAYKGLMNLTSIGEKKGDYEKNTGEGSKASKFRIEIDNTEAFRNYAPDLNRQKFIEYVENQRMNIFGDISSELHFPEPDFQSSFQLSDFSNLHSAANHSNQHSVTNHNGANTPHDAKSEWDALMDGLELELHTFHVEDIKSDEP